MSTMIAKNENQFPVLCGDTESTFAAIKDNLGSDGLDITSLDRVKVPAGGGIAFEVPTLEGTDSAKELEGVIVAWKDSRAYWEGSYGGGNEPPECSSHDCISGTGNPGGSCAVCPMAEFGSAENGSGQACKQMRTILLLTNGRTLPIAIIVPPTSLKNVKKYFLRLASSGKRYSDVVSRFSLVKQKNGTGIEYSEIEVAVARRLEADECAGAKSYGEAIVPEKLEAA